ncbi:putative transmembrane protein [uncultured Stenotrophomonas sp.]|uniref:Putative transmembrane protein n=1 Tax=uncultured Stenotrophomonas sp. TaxID=165438 RepID=A0A1Y5Q9C4_9GAMM|nr:putative transmembrane protein [uncultured Stenotrophomonas sp.]
MRQPHLQRRLPAATPLRAGLHGSVLVLLALFSMLLPQWQGPALPTAAAMLAGSTHAGGEEAPARGFAEEQAPAKLRRAAPLQASRVASSRPAPSLPPACVAGPVPVVPSTVSAAPSACPPATPLHWRLQRGQAPPLA